MKRPTRFLLGSCCCRLIRSSRLFFSFLLTQVNCKYIYCTVARAVYFFPCRRGYRAPIDSGGKEPQRVLCLAADANVESGGPGEISLSFFNERLPPCSPLFK